MNKTYFILKIIDYKYYLSCFVHFNNGDIMARVLVIVGSRREGNSAILAKKIKEALKKERISVDIITPGNQKIYLCTGCMDCDENGVCDFKDDMVDNVEKVKESDYLIFITPTRWNLLSGDLKIFMDRLNPLYASRKLENKKMIALVIGAKKKEEFSTDGALTSLGSFADSSGMKMVYYKEFNECLDFEDILKQEEEIHKTIEDIKKKIKN